MFRSTLGPNKIFQIEYIDYPKQRIKSMTNNQIYSQTVTNYVDKMNRSFQLDFQEPVEQHGLKGHYFVLFLKENDSNKSKNGFIIGTIFRNNNRVYTISYTGLDDKNIDSFMKSFRLLK